MAGARWSGEAGQDTRAASFQYSQMNQGFCRFLPFVRSLPAKRVYRFVRPELVNTQQLYLVTLAAGVAKNERTIDEKASRWYPPSCDFYSPQMAFPHPEKVNLAELKQAKSFGLSLIKDRLFLVFFDGV